MAKTKSLTFYPISQIWSLREGPRWEVRTTFRDFDEGYEFSTVILSKHPIINQSPIVAKMIVADEGEQVGPAPRFEIFSA